jgi:hypothetical protein
MIQKDINYEQVCFALQYYLIILLSHFAGSDKYKVTDKLINANFLSLLKQLNEIRADHKYDIEYKTKDIGGPLGSYAKLFPSMCIGSYDIIIVNKDGKETLIVRHGDTEKYSIKIKEMLDIRQDDKTPSELMTFKLPDRKPSADDFSEFL